MTYTVTSGPIKSAERALAPDLARGWMLWFIALANAAGVVFGGTGIAPHAVGIDRILNLLLVTLVQARAYPVFAVMFGYGLVQLARRQEAAGVSRQRVRQLLLKRNAWLIVFGFVHACLLYYGDFLGAYGLIGVIATLTLLYRSDRVLNIVVWLWGICLLEVFVLLVVGVYRFSHSSGVPVGVPMQMVDSLLATDYLSSLLARLREWPLHTASVLPAILISWLGMWAARRRLLEDAPIHQTMLRWIAVIGLSIAWIGGLPLGLVSAGWLQADESTVQSFFLLHQVSGMFGGPGYAALVGLIVARGLTRAQAGPIAALGQRSLSGYLFQSLVWIVLGLRQSLLTAVLVATLAWLLSLIGAHWLEKNSHPGWAEKLLRKLTYPA